MYSDSHDYASHQNNWNIILSILGSIYILWKYIIENHSIMKIILTLQIIYLYN